MFDCPQTLASQHNPISSLSVQESPSDCNQGPFCLSPAGPGPGILRACFASLSWQLPSFRFHPVPVMEGRQPGIWLTPRSLCHTWQASFPISELHCPYLEVGISSLYYPICNMTERIRQENILDKYVVNEKNCCHPTHKHYFCTHLSSLFCLEPCVCC